MNKIENCSQWRSELFLSFINRNSRFELSAMLEIAHKMTSELFRPVQKYHVFPIPTERWIFIGGRWIFQGISQDGGRADFS